MYNMRWCFNPKTRRPALKILDKDGVHFEEFPFSPYLYVQDPETKEMEKIECLTPTRVREVRKECDLRGIKTFEADVPFIRRVMIDQEIRVSDPEKFLIYDIEVEDSEDFPEPGQAKYRILSIGAKGSDGKEYWWCDDDESKMIRQFLKVAYDYKIVGGWNSLRFDDVYIKNRCLLWLDIPFDEFNIVPIDLLPLYRFVTLVEKTSFSLDNIAKVEGIGAKVKIDIQPGKGRVSRLFHEDRDQLKLYNMNDVYLTFDIEAKYSLINTLFALCQNCFTTPEAHFYLDGQTGIPRCSAFQGIETVLIHEANLSGYRVPTRDPNQQPPTYEGGMVMTPPRLGIIENVAVLDYKSLYPSIMEYFNLGPDTYINDKSGPIKTPLGSFRKDKVSYVASTIKKLMHMKTEIAELKSKEEKGSSKHKALGWRYHSVKVAINSLFGATGFFRSRHYKFEVCQSVQSIERLILPETIRLVREMGYEVVLADTDSVGFVVDNIKEAEEVCEKVNKRIRKWVEQFNGMDSSVFSLEMDKYYSSLMIIAKKKYSGVVVYESGDCCYLYTRGLESVRSDWPEAVKTFQMKLLMLMLTKKNWRKYIKDTKEAFMRGEFDEKMVIAKTLKRKIDEYQGLPPHIRVAELLVGMGKPPRVGDKIQYIKFGDNPEDVIPVIPGTPVILTQKQRSFLWIKQFEAIISRFSVSKNKTLSDFFGE